MKRLTALLVALAVLAGPASAPAQTRKVPRLGLLAANPQFTARLDAFRAGLRALGYEEGKTITIDFRAGPYDRLGAFAAELVRLNPDIVVTDSAPATQAMKRVTTTIPVVFGATADPVGAGFVKTLARPGGNITGFSEITPELTGKRLQLLRELLPGLTNLAVLGNPDHAFHRSMVQGVEAAAKQLGMKASIFEARDRGGIERAFEAITRLRVDAVLALPHPLFANEHKRLTSLAIERHLPMSVTSGEMVEFGGLLAYAPDVTDQFRRAATYVDKILKGAKAADLPVEQPTKFDLFINMKTAKALGLEVPQSLLLRADRVIQ
ncbi:MAG: ABC transporter substrate-binding protein [Candidatus Rokubacteria bacterium]|nr:ABC transporter substrate-binding protein [Candidatus Rokubacteria bacterium]